MVRRPRLAGTIPSMALAENRIACFVSPHGFGHAARAAAIMAALQDRDPAIAFDVFTTVPVWFFEQSGCRKVSFHAEPVDIGFAQRTAFAEDIAETLRRLAAFVPFAPALVTRLATAVRAARCRAVLCDIAPLGIAVAQAAGLPSILVENFTWARLYPAYPATDPRLVDAEVYQAGVPFGYVTRDNYPETPGLVAFIRREMPALHLDREDLHSGCWVERLNELLGLPRAHRAEPNGADQIAEFLLRQHAGRS